MKNSKRLFWGGLAIGLILVGESLAGCAPPDPVAAAGTGLPVAGAGDLYCLSLMINGIEAENDFIPPVSMMVCNNAIERLKSGKAEVAFVGRDLEPEELQGLQDFVIALDAVCIIVDENTYKGGIAFGGGRPMRKLTGFSEMSFDNLVSVFSGSGWQWTGGYYTFNYSLDPASWLMKVDEVAWIKEAKAVLPSFVFPPGKYDTQSVLYNRLGLDENALLSGRAYYSCPKYDKEEEVLSYEYASASYSTEYGTSDFAFKMGFASRRVMTIAPRHIPVKVLTIDGINPLEQPESVADGSYKLARKIHLLIKENASPEANSLAGYLQSAAGQANLRELGFIPVSVVGE
jgi:hypothetical protein